MNSKIIANNIKIARIRCKLNVQQVSEYLGISKSAYYNYERDGDRLKLNTILKLSELYKCNPQDFFIYD